MDMGYASGDNSNQSFGKTAPAGAATTFAPALGAPSGSSGTPFTFSGSSNTGSNNPSGSGNTFGAAGSTPFGDGFGATPSTNTRGIAMGENPSAPQAFGSSTPGSFGAGPPAGPFGGASGAPAFSLGGDAGAGAGFSAGASAPAGNQRRKVKAKFKQKN